MKSLLRGRLVFLVKQGWDRYSHKMRTLIIGGTGFLGPQISKALTKSGTKVFAASRSGAVTPATNMEIVQLDRNQPEAILAAVRTHQIDTVIDVIAYDVETTEPLLNCLDGKIDRYILLSSGDVYRNYGLFQKKETGVPQLTPLTEEAPLRGSLYPYRGDVPRSPDDPLRWMDSYDKIPIERTVRQLETSWSILRLPMVYGPGDKQHRFRWAVAPMAKKKDRLTMATAWADWTTTYGYVENVAAAIAIAAGHPRAVNQVFNIGEEKPVLHTEWATRIAQVMNWSGNFVFKDDPPKGPLADLDLSIPFAVCTQKFREATGFTEPFSLHHCLAETVAGESSLLRD